MKKQSTLIIAAGFAAAVSAQAQTAQPLSISGFNAGLIADGQYSGTSTTQNSSINGFDGGGNVFYDANYASINNLPGGALATGLVTATSGNQYTIASGGGNNALYLDGGTTSGSLTVASAPNLASLNILGAAGNGPTLLDYSLTFANGDLETGSVSIDDWYTSGGGAINGLSRVDNFDNYDFAQPGAFGLSEYSVSIALADQSSILTGVAFSYNDGGSAAIFALSGATPTPEPSTIALAGLGIAGLIAARRRK